tara:strand:- start:153 stop:494 length:342 start_codon:yes stop_codon:yes gene_type:complete
MIISLFAKYIDITPIKKPQKYAPPSPIIIFPMKKLKIKRIIQIIKKQFKIFNISVFEESIFKIKFITIRIETPKASPLIPSIKLKPFTKNISPRIENNIDINLYFTMNSFNKL